VWRRQFGGDRVAVGVGVGTAGFSVRVRSRLKYRAGLQRVVGEVLSGVERALTRPLS